MNAVECSGVTKSFSGVVALAGIDLAVEEGSLGAILGPSGCGKTTLLRVIAGFERPDAGTVVVGGRTVAGPGTHVLPERRRVGIVPQEQALFPHLSVAANVGYGLAGRRDRRARVDDLLALAGLTGLGGRMPHELSGGQQQRVALARALAPEPSVVLLDEPFSGLDAALRGGLRAEVRRMLRASGTTGVVVTHDQEEALSLADSVALMRAGRIVQAGTPGDVYKEPADVWVAEFVGGANVLPGRMAGPAVVACALGQLACRPSAESREVPGLRGPDAVNVVVRPEQLRLAPAGDPEPAAVVAVVEHREYYGHDALARIVLADGTRVMARTRSEEATALGSRVSVTCPGEVIVFPAPATGRTADAAVAASAPPAPGD